MAEAKFFQYKGKPLVRCGDTIYYGDMNDSFVIKMVIKSKQPANDLEVADKVTVQLISTDPNIRITVADYDGDDDRNDLQAKINEEAEELLQRVPMTLVY